jgi:hypothetical protein
VHAEVADDSQCDAETSDTLARGGGTSCVNLKTVADTISYFTMPAIEVRQFGRICCIFLQNPEDT